MRRYRATSSRNKRRFTRTASRRHKKNNPGLRMMRGGYRL